MPLGLAFAWASSLVGGPTAGKALFVLCLTVAFAGAAHLAAESPLPCRLLAGLLYALNPFTLTRLGAGHWAMLASLAVLPWALPTLLQPSKDLTRTFLWSAALGATGFVGGALAGCMLLVGLVGDRGRRWFAVLLRAGFAQLPWALPGLIVLAAGPHLASAAHFPTRGEGALGPMGSVLAGHGFWQARTQVGGQAGTGTILLGIVLLALALYGARDLPESWGRRAGCVAALGVVMAVASSTPGLRVIYDAVSATPLLGALRESQRALALYIVWLGPAAAFGVQRLAGTITLRTALYPALALGCALALAAPGFFGLEGRLEPVQFPAGYRNIRSVIRSQPGTTLALPWHEYLSFRFAGGRLLLNPLPDYLGGDVLASSDPQLGAPHREQADPREPTVIGLLNKLGTAAADPVLRGLAVRWIVLAHEVDWQRYAGLTSDPSLVPVVATSEVTLFRVRSWIGSVTASGQPISDRSLLRPLHRVARSGSALFAQPFAWGWLRGFHPARRSAEGLVSLPAGGGLVWYWPAIVVLAGDVLLIWMILVSFRSLRRRDRQFGPISE